MLSQKDIEEYKRIYKEEFGEEISDQEALAQGTSLINLMKIIYRPIKKSDNEVVKNASVE